MSNKILLPKHSRFLVTGGAGFIGSNLVEKILEQGFFVRILDNFYSGREENIEQFLKNPNFQLIKGDIRNFDDCKSACKGIDYVLHHAAIVSVPESLNKPNSTNDTNINGTLNLLIAAREENVKRFIYASSSAVYGDDRSLFKNERDIGIPLSPYAITKFTNELYARNFYKIYGLPTIGLRYFNVYGKRQNPLSQYSAVIPIFIYKLLNNEAPIIYGNGMQTRDFIYIDDVVQSNIKACTSPNSTFGEVFNIANGNKIEILNLYKKICMLLGKSIDHMYMPHRKGDILNCTADISKARSLLNFTAAYDLEKGLIETIGWFRKIYNLERGYSNS